MTMLAALWPPSTFLVGTVAVVALALHVFFSLRRSRGGLAIPRIGVSPTARRANALTWLGRTVVVALLLALGASGFWESRRQDVATHHSAACHSSGIIVVDLSGSTASPTLLAKIGKSIRTLTQNPKTRIGLVVFSDDAYEVFSPCTKPQAFGRIIEMFIHPQTATVDYGSGWGGTTYTKIVNPWTDTFVGGTSISTGLVAALEAYRRDPHVRGAPVVLISDLANGESEGVLEGALDQYRHFGVPVRIVPVDAAYESRLVYEEHLDDLSFHVSGKTFPEAPLALPTVAGSTPFSWVPLAIAGLLLLVLATSERRAQLRLEQLSSSRKEEKR